MFLSPAVSTEATLPQGQPPAQGQPVVRDVRFGLNQAWEAADAADMAGAGWSRLIIWWSSMQPTGPEDFNLHATDQDSYVDDEVARGRELVGLVMNTPPWASASGSPNAVPVNLYLPWDDEQNHWGQFTRRLAKHYRGRIDAWIIWNEVDIPAGPWRTWNGTAEDYAQLVRVAYLNIKMGNPDARVILYGTPWWYDRGAFLTEFLEILTHDKEAAEHEHYFDAVNLHMYSRANDIPRLVPWYREQLAQHGIKPKPMYVGESNTVPYDDPLWPATKGGFRASMDEQASYIVEAVATFLALKVDRVGVNRIVDGTDFDAGGEPFGLVRNDRTMRPAYRAYQVVTRYFAGAVAVEYHPTDQTGLTVVVLERDGERVTVAWTMRPVSTMAEIPALSPRALQVSKYGEASVVEAEDGVYRFRLAPATANSNDADPNDYVVGGNPVILVERADGDAWAAYRPLDVAPKPVPRGDS